jgi:hypothetical protein
VFCIQTNQTYTNRSIIESKQEALSQLRSEHWDLEKRKFIMDHLLNYLHVKEVEDLESFLKELETKQTELSFLLGAIKSNTDVKTRSELMSKINNLPSISALNIRIEVLESEIPQLIKVFDLCPTCLGKETVYDRSEAEGDPYARSSDYRKTCSSCGGNGKHPKTE